MTSHTIPNTRRHLVAQWSAILISLVALIVAAFEMATSTYTPPAIFIALFALVSGAAVATILVRNSARLRRWLASAMSVSYVGVLVHFTFQAVEYEAWPLIATLVLFMVTALLAGVTLFKKVWWSRWVALGLGLCMLFYHLAWSGIGMAYGNVNAYTLIMLSASTLFLTLISGHTMAMHYELAQGSNTLWHVTDRRMTALRSAMILSICALPTLVLIAVFSSWTGGIDFIPIVLIVGLVAAFALCAWRRTPGLLLLGVMGLGLGTWILAFVADDMLFLELKVMYLAMLLPSVIAAVWASISFAGSMARFVRRGDQPTQL